MNAPSSAPLLVAPPAVAVPVAAAAAPAHAHAAPVQLSKKQLKQAATRERERERAALEAQREAAAAAAAVTAASSSGGGAARSSGGGGGGGGSRSDRERERPRHHKDEQGSNSSGGGGGGGGGGNTRKHERHASSSSSGGAAGSSGAAGPSGASGGGGGGSTPRYTKGLPSQYPASSPTHGGAAANNSNAAAASSAPSASGGGAKQPFLHPPSLFRYHSRKPVPFVMQPGAAAPPLSAVPPFYAPTNLLRLVRSLSPRLPRDFTLGDLWDFYDLPYGHDIDVLLDPQQLLHGAAHAHAHAHTHTHQSSLHALHAQPEGSEVYYVPYLSALVLYERAQAGVDPAVAEAAPPLLQWFERVSPHQRMPLADSIASIASCFSPAPCSPLYELFRPFPSRTILRQLAAHQLDTRRSWYAITWYPILHDPLSTPFLPGAFLIYHGFQPEVDAEGADGMGRAPRCCPLQESTFRGVAEPPVAAVAPVANGTAAAAAAIAVPVRARPPLSEVGSSDVDCGLTTAGEEEEEAGDDADGETEESEFENASSPSAPTSGLARRRQRRAGPGKKAVPPPFPPHLCPHCGDKHGPPVAPPTPPALVQPVAALPAAAAAPSALGYLPLLGYMCHRVLPSTWYVQAFQPAPSAQQQQQPQQQPQPPQQQTATTGPRSATDPTGAPSVQLKQHQQHLQQQQHQLECVSSFNAALHTPAAFTHLSLSQPARLTHADLSLPLHEALQRTQHPDFLHMTAVTQTLK